MTDNRRKEKGFTLIELTLAIAFISFLLLFLVLAILQVTRLYVKGSAIRQINQTGRQLMDDVAASVRVSGVPNVPTDANRLCAGGILYAWNADGETVNKFSGTDAAKELRFISKQDSVEEYCTDPTKDIPKDGTLDLVGPEVTVLRFTATQSGKLLQLQLVLSTSGDNIAKPDATTPTNFSCPADNPFCAFGDFETSVYSRKVE